MSAEAADSSEPEPAVDLCIGAADDGSRLDRFLAARLDLPRNRLQAWIKDGRVLVDGRPAKPSHRLRAGESVVATPPAALPDPRLEPEPGHLDILFADADLIVLDKPAGIAVHPGAGRPGGTLANRLLAFDPGLAGIGGPGRPGIVHRLDQNTTGVMVVARSDDAYRALSRAFAERAVDKHYLAVVHGVPEPPAHRIELPLARHATDRTRMAVRPGGRPATTRYRVRASAGVCALLDLGLDTGRTHQIRVHMKAIGHPLVGDPVYGEARWRGTHGPARRLLASFPRPALHALRLAFDHPRSAEHLSFEAPVPDDLRELWQALGGSWPDSST